MNKFKNNDIVKVISQCQSYGQIGRVIKYIGLSSYSLAKCVQVALECGETKNYNENSLVLADNTIIIGGKNNVNF